MSDTATHLENLRLLTKNDTLPTDHRQSLSWALKTLSQYLAASTNEPISFYVNGFEFNRYNTHFSYDDICIIAGYSHGSTDISVSYRNALSPAAEGELVPGESIVVREGTTFVVSAP